MTETKITTKKVTAKKAAAKKATTKNPEQIKSENDFPKTLKSKKGDENKLRILVKAYEPKVLDISVKQIIDTAKRFEAEIHGPVPLPIEISKYTVNRSTFVYKNAREQFEIRVHKRLIDIMNPNPKLIEALTNLSLPSGVDINVKMG
ncbi:MAG: small subunit ribosomal protein [Patescibacteria group bacterium]|nr:small subunit ribosomal protein [Euryarchaeota archaeon]MDQ1282168.1 small subunit ribosomal protein [Patescibacteria group bacterium]